MNNHPIIQSLPHPISSTHWNHIDDDITRTAYISTLESWIATSIDLPGCAIHGIQVSELIGNAANDMRDEIRNIPGFVSIDRIFCSGNGWTFHFSDCMQTISIGAILECRYDDRDIVFIFGFVHVGSLPHGLYPFSMSLVHYSLHHSYSLLGPLSFARDYFGHHSTKFYKTFNPCLETMGSISPTKNTEISKDEFSNCDRNITSLFSEIDLNAPDEVNVLTEFPEESNEEIWFRPQDLLESPELCHWLA